MNFRARLTAIVVTTLLLLAGILVWMTVLDKGGAQVLVKNSAGVVMANPYSLSFNGQALKGGRNVECIQNPCSIPLPTGSYQLTVKQEGYFEEEASLEVKRGETVKIDLVLRLIPTVVESSQPYSELQAVFEPDRGLDRFRFGMDTKYKKQRLTYRDLGNADGRGGFEMVWAYFDRSLADPAVFPDASLSKGLVVDRADGSMYLVTLQPSKRVWLGTMGGIEDAWWAGPGVDAASWILVKTKDGFFWVNSETKAQRLWEVDVAPFQFVFAPFVLGGDLFFLTNKNPQALEQGGLSNLKAAQTLLKGEEVGASPISLVQYNIVENQYRVIYTFPSDFSLILAKARLGYDGERWWAGDGERVWEVKW